MLTLQRLALTVSDKGLSKISSPCAVTWQAIKKKKSGCTQGLQTYKNPQQSPHFKHINNFKYMYTIEYS